MDLDAFFKGGVKPALGCTEPGAVALATSIAAKHISGRPERISLRLSANIYKNGVNVGVPKTNGLTGNNLAAALGAIAGDPSLGLQSLANVRLVDVEEASRFVASGAITNEIVSGVPDVYTKHPSSRLPATLTSPQIIHYIWGRAWSDTFPTPT